MKNLTPLKSAFIDGDKSGTLIDCLLFDCLLSLESRVRRIKCGPILCELHNSGKISLVAEGNLTAIAKLELSDFWLVIHPLNQAIPGLKCAHREILELVNTLVKKAGSDIAAGMPNRSLVQWCSLNPHEAEKIVADTISLDQLCVAHCVLSIQGLDDAQLAYSLLMHSDKTVVAIGLRSLGRLDLKVMTEKNIL